MTRDEVSIDLTTEELMLLTERLEVEALPGMAESQDAIPDEYRAVLRDQAESALVARGVLEPPPDEPDDHDVAMPTDAVGALIRAAAKPALLTTASHESKGVVETRFYSSSPEFSVEHRSMAMSVYRLSPFATRDLMARVLRFVDLRPAEPSTVDPIETTVEALEACSEQLAGHDHAAGVAALTATGVSEVAADALAETLKAKRASASVTHMYKPTDDKVAGGRLTWIDAGLEGLWLTEPEDEGRLVVTPCSAEDLASELLTYLPGPFGGAE